MSLRNPLKDQVAVVGVGSTGFSRSSDASGLDLLTHAAVAAIRDAGFSAADIDGVVVANEPGGVRTRPSSSVSNRSKSPWSQSRNRQNPCAFRRAR